MHKIKVAHYPIFAKSILAAALARAFTLPPEEPIWKFADHNVVLQREDAAEVGPYRSAKTPWTRRLQELARRPSMWHWDYAAGQWTRVRVTEINAQKSTQSGFTEAILNVIRWFAKYLPRNVMYRIDAVDRAKKIARRLLRSLKILDPTIFTGDPDDIKTTEFILRGMEVWFIGSFNPGQATQVQAAIVVNDEIEEHAESGDISVASDRKKTHRRGLEFNIGKPKLEGGPINKLWKRGNKEEFHITCPHCGLLQWITHRSEEFESPFSDELMAIDSETGKEIEPGKRRNREPANAVYLPRPLPLGETRKVKTGRFVYEHCKDLLGNWDKLRIKRDIYYECPGCKGKIFELKRDDDGHIIGVGIPQKLVLEAAERDGEMLGWLPTAIGTPGIVSQHMSDLLSSDEGSLWGDIMIELIDAKKEGRQQIQGVVNKRFGNAWREELNRTDEADIKLNVAGRSEPDGSVICPPYKRGTIPFVPSALLLGADVGGNYARWVVTAAMENMIDQAVIDWGDELDPETIAEIVLTSTWPCLKDGKRRRLNFGFIDAKFRRSEVLRVCWHVFKHGGHRLIPVAGIGGAAARGVRVWAYTPISTYRGQNYGHTSFKKLDFNDREAKNDLYISCIAKKQRRIFFPVELGKPDGELNLDERQFIQELCAEELVEDKYGRKTWNEVPTGPNHYGDSLKNATTGLRFLTRKHHLSERPGESKTTVETSKENEGAEL